MAKILEGKVAIVTGSGQGIGRAIACKLAADGAKVVTNNRCPEPTSNKQISDEQYNSLPAELRAKFEAAYEREAGNAETTAAKIIAEGGEASPFYADIGKFDQAKALVEHTVNTYGKVDMVVNVAGAFGFGSICDITEEIWDRVINTKLKGYFNMMHFAAPYMIEQKWGRIINCTSRAFLGDWILHPEYCAANAGIIGLTRAGAIELYPHNITLNAFSPIAKSRAAVDLEAALSLEDTSRLFMPGFKAHSADQSPPAEALAPFISWLCTDAAKKVSGSVFALANNSIALYSEPEEKAKVIKFSPEFWNNDELNAQLPRGLFTGYSSLAEPEKMH